MYDLVTNEFLVSRDVSFDEDVFPYQLRDGEFNVSPGQVITEFIDIEPLMIPREENNEAGVPHGTEVSVDVSENVNQLVDNENVSPLVNPDIRAEEVTPPVHHSQRERHPPKRFNDYVLYNAKARQPVVATDTHTPPVLPASSSTSSTTVQGTPLYSIEYYVSDEVFSPKHQAFLAAVSSSTEPQFYHEAIKDMRWRKAMSQEVDALEENKT